MQFVNPLHHQHSTHFRGMTSSTRTSWNQDQTFLCAVLNKHGNVTRIALCLPTARIDLFWRLLDVKWGSFRNAAHGQESSHSADRLNLALRGTPGEVHSSLKTEAGPATETSCFLSYLLTPWSKVLLEKLTDA